MPSVRRGAFPSLPAQNDRSVSMLTIRGVGHPCPGTAPAVLRTVLAPNSEARSGEISTGKRMTIRPNAAADGGSNPAKRRRASGSSAKSRTVSSAASGAPGFCNRNTRRERASSSRSKTCRCPGASDRGNVSAVGVPSSFVAGAIHPSSMTPIMTSWCEGVGIPPMFSISILPTKTFSSGSYTPSSLSLRCSKQTRLTS